MEKGACYCSRKLLQLSGWGFKPFLTTPRMPAQFGNRKRVKSAWRFYTYYSPREGIFYRPVDAASFRTLGIVPFEQTA